MKIKRFNESLRNKMTPKSKEELDKKYNDIVENVFNATSRYDIIDNVVVKIYNDPDNHEDGKESVLYNIALSMDEEEFKNTIKKLIKQEVYGN